MALDASASDAHSETYHRAVAQIRAGKRETERNGHVVMSVFMAPQNGVARAAHWARLFCIGFAFVVPNLLVWRVLL